MVEKNHSSFKPQNMEKLLLKIFLIFWISSFSQIKNGIIEYQVDFKKDEKILDSLKINNPMIFNLIKSQKPVNTLLFFQDKNSFYAKEHKMEIDKNEQSFDLISLFMGGVNANYFTDLNRKKINIEKQLSEVNYLISYSFLDWKLLNETKKIGFNTVYKAIAIQEIYTRKGVEKQKIIAWYCPEIPLGFGPKEYCGLPGLVLEVNLGNINFVATKIKLNLKERVILNNPKKSKNITSEEYELLIKNEKEIFNIKKF